MKNIKPIRHLKLFRLALTIVFFLLLSAGNSFSLVIVWTQRNLCPFTAYPYGIAVDPDHNVYVTGEKYFQTTYYNYYTIKYTASGVTVWTQIYTDFNGLPGDSAHDLAIDKNRNVYVTGTKENAAENDMLTIKYDSSGVAQWTQRYPGFSYAQGLAVAVDSRSNIYAGGYAVRPVSGGDCILIKYRPAGNAVWTQFYSVNNNTEAIQDLVMDADDNIYAAADMHNGANNDFGIVKFDKNGTVLWKTQYNPAITDSPKAVAVDSSRNIYLAGGTWDGSDWDMLLAKFDSTGHLLWTNRFDSGPIMDFGNALAVDPEDNIYAAGQAAWDYLIIKYDPDGRALWTNRYDSGASDYINDIALDDRLDIYVTGGVNGGFYTIKYIQPPNKPLLTGCTAVSKETVQLEWLDKVNEDGYIVFRSADNISFSPVKTLGANSVSFQDTGLLPDTAYYYRVIATNAAGRSPASEALSARSTALESMGEVSIAPNPFKPSSQNRSRIVIYNLPLQFEMSVYSVTGAMVARLNATSSGAKYEWEPRDSNSRLLKSGTYFLRISSGAADRIFKLVIIR